MSEEQQKVLRKLLACRQPELGGHLWRCRWCGHTHLTYNSCRNRHCPTCGGVGRADWLEKVMGWSLPTSYLHLVITLPHELEDLLLANPKRLYRLLIRGATEVLTKMTRELYGALPGWVIVLHTWGQEALYHVHIHIVQTAGGLSLDGTRWVEMHAGDEAFSKEYLGVRFRDHYVRGLIRLFRRGELALTDEMSHVELEEDFRRWLEPLASRAWHTHCQGPPPDCQGGSAVLKYLARYVKGSVISDHRILADDGKQVTIRKKDYSTGEVQPRCMPGPEFVRRFLLHVLPARMHRVCYAGLFTPRYRKQRLATCRALLGVAEPAGDDPHIEHEQPEEEEEQEEKTGPTCPRCLMPDMRSLGRCTAGELSLFLIILHRCWQSAITIVTTWHCDASRGGCSRSFLEAYGEWLTWTVTTLPCGNLLVASHTHPPDT